MDIWGQIWFPGQIGGKVHKAALRSVTRRIGLFTKFSTIWTMVEMTGIQDDTDILATARAARDQRNEWRTSYNPDRKAICA